MPLNLTLSRGTALSIDDLLVQPYNRRSATDFSVLVHGKEYDITPENWVEVAPGCLLRSTLVEDLQSLHGKVRVSIDAPGKKVFRVSIPRSPE